MRLVDCFARPVHGCSAVWRGDCGRPARIYESWYDVRSNGHVRAAVSSAARHGHGAGEQQGSSLEDEKQTEIPMEKRILDIFVERIPEESQIHAKGLGIGRLISHVCKGDYPSVGCEGG